MNLEVLRFKAGRGVASVGLCSFGCGLGGSAGGLGVLSPSGADGLICAGVFGSGKDGKFGSGLSSLTSWLSLCSTDALREASREWSYIEGAADWDGEYGGVSGISLIPRIAKALFLLVPYTGVGFGENRPFAVSRTKCRSIKSSSSVSEAHEDRGSDEFKLRKVEFE
jgi:hypothetical protein